MKWIMKQAYLWCMKELISDVKQRSSKATKNLETMQDSTGRA